MTACDLLRSDHRRIEAHLDRLLAALLKLTPEGVPEVRREFDSIRALAEPHFAREETVFYPRLRPSVPELLARLDEQHEHTRELERVLAELLAGPHRLGELRRLGIEFHDSIQHHIVEEEDQLLRIADAELSEAEQRKLAEEMDQSFHSGR